MNDAILFKVQGREPSYVEGKVELFTGIGVETSEPERALGAAAGRS